jgi:O-antigen/teichoic acid export membrane protein
MIPPRPRFGVSATGVPGLASNPESVSGLGQASESLAGQLPLFEAGNPDATPSRSLFVSTVRGFLFTGGQVVFVRLLSLVSFTVLARLLSPHDYGVAALANVFVALFSLLAAGGFGQALVQKKILERRDSDTVFWLCLAIGAALTLIMAGLAYPLASLLNSPQLGPVLLVLSLNFVVVGLSSTQNALLQRSMQFKKLASVTVVSNILATVAGVAFAFAGFGVWALVIQTLLAPAFAAAGLWRASSYRPKRQFSREAVGPIFAVSRQFVGASFMFFASTRTDDFLVGAELGSVTLGVYTVAFRITTVLADILNNSVRLVAFPAFARLQDRPDRLRVNYLLSLRLSVTVAMPCFVFSAAASPQIVQVLFGAKWLTCVPSMRVLCASGALATVLASNATLLQATGHARLQFRLSTAGTILQVIAFFATAPFGIVWVSAAYVFRAYLIAPIGLKVAATRAGTTLTATLLVLAAPILCCLLMAGGVLAISHAVTMSALPLLALLLASGLVVYLLAMSLLARQHLREVFRVFTVARTARAA